VAFLFILGGLLVTLDPLAIKLFSFTEYGESLSEILVGAIVFPLAFFLVIKFIEKEQLSNYYFPVIQKSLRGFILGNFIGAIGVLAIFVTLLVFSYIDISSTNNISIPLLLVYGSNLITAISEEIIFRSFIYKKLESIFAKWNSMNKYKSALTILSTSILFIFIHVANPSFTHMSAIGLFLLGVTLAVSLHVSKNIYIPIGLHVAWNFFQEGIFGFNMSGWEALPQSIFKLTVQGPAWVTGGNFGPEASVVGFMVLIIIPIILLKRPLKETQI
ncbi:CPBP family intramembrane metalloprotease, partial [Candidatus Dojkabacteria bacterium]|nr:CPBP family intramembrane metalloprotease [Candidatus Dojkabacteria bacterium]